VRLWLAVLALALSGCAGAFYPAMLVSHESDPRDGAPFNDRADSEVDFGGLGICWEARSTDACVFGGVRHERNGHVTLATGAPDEETGFATQGILLHKFKGRVQ
jgi:hypothetical protein